jgi:hypothetical protein
MADYYLEVGFTAGNLAPGASTGQIQNRFNKNDWSMYTQTNDYSYDASKSQFADWSKVTLYLNGKLVWGIEPTNLGGPSPSQFFRAFLPLLLSSAVP